MIVDSARRKPLASCCLAFVFVWSAAIHASAPAPRHAGIASAHPLATEAGVEILHEGGNAFDAAVAIAAALAVVEPTSSGLGGGGFFLLHRAADHLETMIDAREVAPAAATRNMFLDSRGEPVPNLSTRSALAAAIPGEPAGLAYLAAKFGKLPLKQSLQPAIKLAERGFPLYTRLRGAIAFRQQELSNTAALAAIYLVNGEVPPEGTVIKQPELARSLRLFAELGASGFYEGALARQLVDGVRGMNGIWTMHDLESYTIKERTPVIGEYRGARIVSAPPPSSGGVSLIEALNILSGYDLHALDAVTRKHVILEAMRRVHRDRAEYFGDPGFVTVPVKQLIQPSYAAGLRASLRLDRATPSDSLPGINERTPAGTQTTHFSVIDARGNRVAATLTLNFYFGSALMVPGTGILLNNEMDDFSVKPGVPNGFALVGAEANSIAPLKRPLSSLTPTFVETPDKVLVIGTPGGSRIMGMVLLGILDWLDGGNPNEVVSLPRYHHQYLPDVVTFEPAALTPDEKAQLQARGHKLEELQQPYGNLQIVTLDKTTGAVRAASDPRGVGVGWVY
jgi:gamma-glutamyltranspeptidase/glutathione hydrolase